MRPRTGEAWIDNTPLREAVEGKLASGEQTLASICWTLGYTKIDRRGAEDRRSTDTTKLKRRLGMAPCRSRHYGRLYASTSKTIHYDGAVKIAEAAGIDPVEVGL